MEVNKYLLILMLSAFFLTGCIKNDNISEPPNDGDANVDLSHVIKNSGFESTSDGIIPEYWLTRIVGQPGFNYFSFDTTVFKTGGKSVKIYFNQGLSNPDPVSGAWGGLYQTMFVNDLKPGQRYYLNFWMKSETGRFQIRLAKNGDLIGRPLLSYIVSTPTDWVQQKVAFTIDTETNFIEFWVSTKTEFAKDGLVTGWIDEVKLTGK
jgi:hypothetical protein